MHGSASTSRTKVILTAFALFCCSLFLTAYSTKNQQLSRVGYWALGEVQRPLHGLSESLLTKGIGLWRGYVMLVDVRKENEELRERLNKIEAEVVRLSEVRAENERLARVVSFVEETKLTGVMARVIAFSSSSWVHSATINRGSVDGIGVDMAVVDGRGVVGQVIAASPHSSNVLLATDPTSGVDAVLQDSRSRGVISGAPRGRYVLKFLARDQDVKVGERIVTSGIGGIFPSGLLLGEVSDVKRQTSSLFQEIDVLPAVDFSKLEEVLVVTHIPASKKHG